ncbi:4Fe-4S dicluster domain-containing protein [Fusibacter paucivorans]|uniref:4Fe-4S dicluster domain-containing protein n=2 Tax=Fusibacter paucivorans TaxID=76009 RepID=A0ABS5PU15_9FIRM|nr:4Fe-4S dicluster domain-containing protein [Fusibacter paucivorans]MBS7528573.1 4Fe-4S dicluster domain-containing protein [Fusibacter paucivorans]
MIKSKFCVQCGLCISSCPKKLLRFSEITTESGEKKNVIISTDPDSCLFCGACMRVCPLRH